jgi:adenine-specific DNA-methyltransferase
LWRIQKRKLTPDVVRAALLERRRVHQSRCTVNGVRRARICTERRDGRAAIRKLVLEPAHPTRHDLDVLEGIAANGLANDPDRLYLR